VGEGIPQNPVFDIVTDVRERLLAVRQAMLRRFGPQQRHQLSVFGDRVEHRVVALRQFPRLLTGVVPHGDVPRAVPPPFVDHRLLRKIEARVHVCHPIQ